MLQSSLIIVSKARAVCAVADIFKRERKRVVWGGERNNHLCALVLSYLYSTFSASEVIAIYYYKSKIKIVQELNIILFL